MQEIEAIAFELQGNPPLLNFFKSAVNWSEEQVRMATHLFESIETRRQDERITYF